MGIETESRTRNGGQDKEGITIELEEPEYITAWGWDLTSPHSANGKQASRIINNSDCCLTQSFLHHKLMRQHFCYQGPPLSPSKPSTIQLKQKCTNIVQFESSVLW